MTIKTFFDAIKNPSISALIAAVVVVIFGYFASKHVAKIQTDYSFIKLKTYEMNLAIKSFANNLHEMNSMIVGAITVKHGISIESFIQDKSNLHRQKVYETVKDANILPRIKDEIRELEKMGFFDFLSHYNENAYQIYLEYKCILLGDLQNEIEKIAFAHSMLLCNNKKLSGKSFQVVLTEIDKMSIQQYIEEQW
ncbi:hypothetical protein HQ587_09935 [bacterium]|nr:hypothetical protein [bacterium]